jgi:hypothetical protein
MPYFKTFLPLETIMQGLNNVADNIEKSCAIASGDECYYIASNDFDLIQFMRVLKEFYTEISQSETVNKKKTFFGFPELFTVI